MAERAHDRGDHRHARELYLKAVGKFKDACEISDDFNEISIIRSLINYYKNRAVMLEREIGDNLNIENLNAEVPEKKRGTESDIDKLLKGTGISHRIFEEVIVLANEISREGREGRSIGTAFIVGDSTRVLASSRQLILNPFQGYRRNERIITDPDIHDNVKEFAQLDGVFVISGDGVVEAAGRYITIDTGMIRIPAGLGTRHSSVAAITCATESIGIVVSQSGGIIRIFKHGKIAAIVKS